eukprot:CAMPEP_0198117162 /NCGR_PEP_ID=MMETSP1442-20131203/16755_1 /TAXON_ID= /ORGANISM="Craspedostauros australis, Strain CCMP3328" /LENGTH=175 /DNA_ID=CAMNT_0043775153 /DNA_START=121 /DNA_END=646 /DNA_ORIENTATION=+
MEYPNSLRPLIVALPLGTCDTSLDLWERSGRPAHAVYCANANELAGRLYATVGTTARWSVLRGARSAVAVRGVDSDAAVVACAVLSMDDWQVAHEHWDPWAEAHLEHPHPAACEDATPKTSLPVLIAFNGVVVLRATKAGAVCEKADVWTTVPAMQKTVAKETLPNMMDRVERKW